MHTHHRTFLISCAALFVSCISLVYPLRAEAGDPCPIDLVVYDAASPRWLDHTALLSALTSKDSWVGASFRTATSSQGVRITRVSPKSPAARAGLQKKDRIVSIAGQPITGGHRQAAALFRAAAPNTTISLSVVRNQTTHTIALVLGEQDPFIGKLIDVASTQECRAVWRGSLSDEDQARVLRAAFAMEKGDDLASPKRFACSSAHKALGRIKGLEGGALIVVRGSKRLLVAQAGWATECVQVRDFDGVKLTDARVRALLERVTSAYVRDRYENP